MTDTLPADEQWREQAACRGMPQRWFFPDTPTDARRGRAVCNRCPVIGECADAGREEMHGIWAGRLHKPVFGYYKQPLPEERRTYDSPRPCRTCGSTERYMSSDQCAPCNRERKRLLKERRRGKRGT